MSSTNLHSRFTIWPKNDQSIEHNAQDDAVMTLKCFVHMLEQGARMMEIDTDEAPAV